MKTYNIKYNFGYSKQNKPSLNIILDPYFDDYSLISGSIECSTYTYGQPYLDDILENLKKLTSKEIEYYEFGEEWAFFECDNESSVFSDINKSICSINTNELYNVILQWRKYFLDECKKNKVEILNIPYYK